MSRFHSRIQSSTFLRSAQILSSGDRQKILVAAILQISLGLLDLIGVMIIGLLGALSMSGIQSNVPPKGVNSVLELLRISNLLFETQVFILSALAGIFLIGRTFLSILFTRRILFFFSRRGARISADLVSQLLSQSFLVVQKRTTHEILYAVTRGVELIMLQVLATALVLVSDFSLLIIMGIGLAFIDPLTALGTFLIFGGLGVLLYRFMRDKVSSLGVESSRLNVKGNEKILEVFGSYRESVVRNRRDYYAREIGSSRFQLADTMAEMNFMPFVSKYVIETSLVLGALLIGLVQFILQDATQAIATLAIFLAAGARIAPAVLRLQQGSIQIRGSLGMANPTLELIDSLGESVKIDKVDDDIDVNHFGFVAEIHIESISLTYPGEITPALTSISLSIPSGSMIAIVGPSGAGKSTLIDILLGVLSPDQGNVFISGLQPHEAIAKWPGAISYVPQDILIASGTIRENVALGYPSIVATDELVMNALRIAELDEYVSSLPQGIDTHVGERGSKISGGQRQRLGIARAMFTHPQLLVLDEATSSLDGVTEASISESFQALRGETTIVMIAHRLSTVRNADIVVYLSKGKIVSAGTFSEVRKAVPDFDHQAKLMGL